MAHKGKGDDADGLEHAAVDQEAAFELTASGGGLERCLRDYGKNDDYHGDESEGTRFGELEEAPDQRHALTDGLRADGVDAPWQCPDKETGGRKTPAQKAQ